MLRLTVALIVLVGCFSVTESRRTHQRRSQHANHRYFDDFLLSVVSNGFVPPDVETSFSDVGTRVSDNQQSRHPVSSIEEDRTGVPDREQPVNTAHQSLRNYIRRQHEQERERPLDEFTTQVPEMSTEESPELPSASSDNEIFSLALQRHRSTQPETRRRHSRRNLQDLDTIHQSMSGIPKAHWSCCLLGQLAGDKGFLCDAQFYASRVLNRNANRVHNRRLSGTYFNNGEATASGRDVIQTFNSCVQDPQSASEFTTCCSRTLAEYNNRNDRWREFSEAVRPAY